MKINVVVICICRIVDLYVLFTIFLRILNIDSFIFIGSNCHMRTERLCSRSPAAVVESSRSLMQRWPRSRGYWLCYKSLPPVASSQGRKDSYCRPWSECHDRPTFYARASFANAAAMLLLVIYPLAIGMVYSIRLVRQIDVFWKSEVWFGLVIQAALIFREKNRTSSNL